MANAVYPKAKNSFLTQNPSIDWDTDTIKAILARGYTFVSTHQYLADVTGAGATLVGNSGGSTGAAGTTIGSRSATNGVADGAAITWTSVTSGSACSSILIYKSTGSDSSCALIAYIDTASSGLPVTPNGGDINVTWDSGASKILAL